MRDDHRNAPAGGADDRPGGAPDGAGPHIDGAGVPIDGADLHADDLLLDALGRGAAAPDGDPFAALLAGWRADLDHDQPDPDADLVRAFCGAPATVVPAGSTLTVAEPAVSLSDPAASPRPDPAQSPPRPNAATSPRPDSAASPRPSAPDRRGPAGSGPATRNRHRHGPGRRTGRLRRLLIGVATALVGVAALGIGANNAGPTSPLWPVAQLVYPEQAAGRAAEHEIDLARQAVTDRRYDQARQHLDRADAHVAEVTETGWARQLSAEIARLRAALPPEPGREPAASPPSRPTPDTPGTPAGPTPSPRPGGSTAPGGGQPGAPTPAPTRPGLLPPLLPSPLLPNLPLVPSLLPSGLPLI